MFLDLSIASPCRMLKWNRALAVLMTGLLTGCTSKSNEPAESLKEPSSDAVVASGESQDPDDPQFAAIRTFCGDCHAMPMPASFPKAMWYEEVRRGFNFYYESGRRDLKPPAQANVVAYFRQFAPEQLPLADQLEAAESPVRFVGTDVRGPAQASDMSAAVSFVDFTTSASGSTDLWLSDMKSGAVIMVPQLQQSPSTDEARQSSSVVRCDATVSAHPAVVRQLDLDANGRMDLLVTDLGSFLPEDHDRGKLVWVPDGATTEPGSPVVLWKGVGRVADVQPGDFDGDGLTDLAVAEFGWHKTGSVTLLRNVGPSVSSPAFEPRMLDNRSGAIHVIPKDIDGDGRLDLIALLSQEHEQIVAYLNKPAGFEMTVLYAAPDPSWGSSGLQLIDLDRDGDEDLIYTNGDSFDSKLVKPYHGVWWLENIGELRFTAHHITAMPGVHRALAADFDGDGDLDVAAAAMLPSTTVEGLNADELHAVVWLEQTADHQFVRHVIERGVPSHAAMAVSDFNNDGRPDIVVGMFEETSKNASTVARVFWNEGP